MNSLPKLSCLAISDKSNLLCLTGLKFLSFPIQHKWHTTVSTLQIFSLNVLTRCPDSERIHDLSWYSDEKILDVKKFTINNCIGSTKSSVSSFHFTLVKNRFLSDKWLYFGIHRLSVRPCDRWPSRESLAWVKQQNRFQFYLDLIMFEIFLEHGYHYRPYKRFRLWRDSKLNFLNHFWTWSEVR